MENYHAGVSSTLGKRSKLDDLKGERDETRLARHPESIVPIFEGLSASKVIWSAVLLELWDGDPCNSKDTGVINVLETMEDPENGHVGIRASSPKR